MEDKNFIENTINSGIWSERVLVVTKDYEIKGFVYMPKVGKKGRLLSDILNGQKRFIAIKDCEITYRNQASRRTEMHQFIQINLYSIIMLRPISVNE